MATNFMLIGSILLLLPFSAFMYIVLLSRSMSVHLARAISPILAPVSLSSCSRVDVFIVPAVIRESISFSVGMNGKPSSLVYLGLFHSLFMYFKYPSYIVITLFLLEFFQFSVANVAFTSSGS